MSIDRCTTIKRRTHETLAIDLPLSPHVVQHIAVIHPSGDHTKLKQLRRDTLNTQNILVSYSLTDDDLLAIFLWTELQ